MKYKELGSLIRQYREQLGWGQTTLAKTVQVRQQTVSRWEKGESRPERDMIVQLARIFKTDLDSILAVACYELSKPVRPLLKILPLSNLNAEEFELFCCDLLRALFPNSDVSRYGGQGDTQEGIDIFVKNGTRILDFQCKRHAQFGPTDVATVVENTTFESEHHHLLLSRNASAAARKAILGYPHWSLWDNEDISGKLRVLPNESALRIVNNYFPGWSKDFLGIEEISPWLTPEEFFRPYANRVKLFSHDWSFVGREIELTALNDFLGSDDRALVVVGRGGVGKSRLLRAFCQTQPSILQIRLILANADIKPMDLELLPKNGILIIDDAHENADFFQLLNTIAVRRPEIRVIISTRPYGLSQIQYNLTSTGFIFDDCRQIKLNDLSVEAARALSLEILSASNGNIDYANRIAELTKDCPLATVVGSRLVAKGQINPDLLNNSDEFRNQLLRTYYNIIIGDIGGKDREQISELLYLIATIQPVNPSDPLFEAVASVILERRYDKILRDLTDLENSGVLLRRRNTLRITPDLLADHIRAEAAYSIQNARPTGYADLVFKAVKDQLATNLIVNLSQLDWRLSAIGTQTELLNSIWSALEIQFRDSGIHARKAILKSLEKVAYYQPSQVLKIIDLAINEPIEESAKSNYFGLFDPTYNDVLSDIPPILKYVGYNYECLPRVLDLLRQLALNDNRATNQYPNHPLRILQELASVEPGKPINFNKLIADHVLFWLEKPGSECFSPFDVLDSVLATEGHQTEASGVTLTFKPFIVNAGAVTEIRKKIVDAALRTIIEKPLPEAIRAVKTIGEALRGPRIQGASEEQQDQWMPEQLTVLRQLQELMVEFGLTVDPYITVEVRKVVSWHATFSQSETRPAAKAVLDAIPITMYHELSRALADGWGETFERGEDFRRDATSFVAWRIQIADRLIEDHLTNFSALLGLLEERVTALAKIKQGGDSGPFIGVLANKSSEFGKFLCRYILDHLDSPLTVFFGSALIALSEKEYEAALAFAEEGVATDNETLLVRISWAIGWGFKNIIQDEGKETEIIKSLMSAMQTGVRKNIVNVVSRFSNEQRSNAIAILLSINFRDSTEVADEVLQQFGKHGPFDVSDLTDSEIENILLDLVKLDSIDDYHIEGFLGVLSRSHPLHVLKLLMNRVENMEAITHLQNYIPFSYDHHKRGSICFSATELYEQLLRHVRDWSDERSDSWVRRHYGPRLFMLVSAGFDQVTLGVLDEWITSPIARHIEAAASLLSEAPRLFLWDNFQYVLNIIERAQQHGSSCYECVCSHMHAIAMEGVRSGIPGKPFPEDIEQSDKSKIIMDRLPAGSAGYRFYKSLYEEALSNIKRNTIEDEDLFDD